ncbi:AbrB/MazE/SpoVT family DNA-binding domain-containing protein [Halorientalis brevis]|uniref:AbrB/MazE/SpoVT family DNA-binding domain-containing protein n=1 Tax=Halorientalis brevis TaxID=1126241 RepID=A0ABD6CAZ9_9EURY|nr:AbrB/MazE/SpoVT family DNA-binding domain-containing protein [Halorientalis brevis]
MFQSEERKVGERGQVTIPKELREKLDIHGGDEVIIHEEDGKITIEKPVSRDELAEGYRQYAESSEALAEEMADVSREADQYHDDAPDW